MRTIEIDEKSELIISFLALKAIFGVAIAQNRLAKQVIEGSDLEQEWSWEFDKNIKAWEAKLNQFLPEVFP